MSPNPLPNTISISINDANTLKRVVNIPWYPGITVLQAMVIAQAMEPGKFSFRAVYHSFFGAFIDRIDDTPEHDGRFWLLAVSNNPSAVGVSEAILPETAPGQNVDIEWSFLLPEEHPTGAAQGDARRRAGAVR